ncbi:hypothetical protein F2Q68_00044605 [Brassica cretica]|uniref:Uncharacterized protein n=1 Tax=Brassica cretica TaxID=69181 RepID=A0A8S9LMF5_BRACR|nr:hypothetical protein F2Q68_00044605 [Brassica cretica]
MLRRLPQELAFEDVRQIHLLLLFFKNCKETQVKIKALYTKALSTPALKVVPKVDEPGKFIFSCSIAGVEFKEALCDFESVDTQKIYELIAKVVQRLKKITKGKSSSWRKLRLSRFRTLKRLLPRLKRRETISKRSTTSTDMGICRKTRHKNQQQPESNQQAPSAPANGPPYEQKGLGMMMQQLLQGQHVQAKALNQVTTDINTWMDNMFTELSTKYDTVASHIRKIFEYRIFNSIGCLDYSNS